VLVVTLLVSLPSLTAFVLSAVAVNLKDERIVP
jgi:hypothetical protein